MVWLTFFLAVLFVIFLLSLVMSRPKAIGFQGGGSIELAAPLGFCLFMAFVIAVLATLLFYGP